MHPYAKVPDATKAGAPPSRDFSYPRSQPQDATHAHAKSPTTNANTAKPHEPAKATAIDANVAKPREPAYRTQPAGLDPGAEDRVFQRNFVEASSIVMTPMELLSLSPALCKRVHRATANKRVAFEQPAPSVPQAPVAVNRVAVDDSDDDDALPYLTREEAEAYYHSYQPAPVPSFAPQPAKSYQLRELPPEDAYTDDVVVGAATQKLRAIAAWVNDQAMVECILDPGSQIVAISATKCYELGIPYDHTATIPMQSANGAVDRTLGLARNVLFELRGGIVLQLQMHVVDTSSYDILLGRPFDVLVSCIAKNDPSGRQEIVVTCPNTGRSLTLPTYARGEAPRTSREPPAGFQTSRI